MRKAFNVEELKKLKNQIQSEREILERVQDILFDVQHASNKFQIGKANDEIYNAVEDLINANEDNCISFRYELIDKIEDNNVVIEDYENSLKDKMEVDNG